MNYFLFFLVIVWFVCCDFPVVLGYHPSNRSVGGAHTNSTNKPDKPQVTIITGTGRCGTSLLMALFTKLNFQTGFDAAYVQRFVETGLSGFEVGAKTIIQKFSDPSNFAKVTIFKSPFLIHPTHIESFVKIC
jgi:hypothetical protein